MRSSPQQKEEGGRKTREEVAGGGGRLPPEWEREESPQPLPKRTPNKKKIAGRSSGVRTPSPSKAPAKSPSPAARSSPPSRDRGSSARASTGGRDASSSPQRRRAPLQIQDTYAAHRRPHPSPDLEELVDVVRRQQSRSKSPKKAKAATAAAGDGLLSRGEQGVKAAWEKRKNPMGGWAMAAGVPGMYSDEYVQAIAQSMELLRREGIEEREYSGASQGAPAADPIETGGVGTASNRGSILPPLVDSSLREAASDGMQSVEAARELLSRFDDIAQDGQRRPSDSSVAAAARQTAAADHGASSASGSGVSALLQQASVRQGREGGVVGQETMARSQSGSASYPPARHSSARMPSVDETALGEFESQPGVGSVQGAGHVAGARSEARDVCASDGGIGRGKAEGLELLDLRRGQSDGYEGVGVVNGNGFSLPEGELGQVGGTLRQGNTGMGKTTRSHTGLSLKFAGREARRNTFNFCLAFTAVFIAVTMVATAHTVYRFTPILFLSIAEFTVGQRDVVVGAGSWTGIRHLNFSKIITTLGRESDFRYSSPRLVKDIDVFDLSSCDKADDGLVMDTSSLSQLYFGPQGSDCFDDSSSSSPCIRRYCGKPLSGTMYALDFAREEAMGLGRQWSKQAPGPGEVLIQREFAERAGLSVGGSVAASVSMESYLKAVLSQESKRALGEAGLLRSDETWQVIVPLTVTGIFDEPGGKFDNDETKGVVLDYDDLFRRLPYHIREDLAVVAQDVRQANHLDYVSSVTFNLPPPRLEQYMDNDYGKIQKRVLSFVSRIVTRLGYENVQADITLLSELRKLRIFSLFLGLIISIVMTSLVALLTLLIYSLLIVSVETRTFDLGVMRMVGMTRAGIVQLLLTQTLVFSVPAWALGLVAANFLAALILQKVGEITRTEIETWLVRDSVAWATVMGLLVPCFAALLPIRMALTSTLHDALDINRPKTSAVQVTVERASDGRPPAYIIIGGVTLSTFGFMVYYLFPRALLELNLPLLMYIFFGLLIGMLLGLALLSLNFEKSAEHLVGHLLLWWNGASIKAMMFKNLAAHRLRNRKTTMMYSLSLAFIIFIVVTFGLQILTFDYQYKQASGSLLRLRCPKYADGPALLASLRTLTTDDPYIQDIAWLSHSIYSVSNVETRIYTIGKTSSAPQYVYAASPNLFDATLPGFLVIDKSDEGSGYSLSEQLYTPKGSQSALLGSLYQAKLSLDLDSAFLLRTTPPTLDRDVDPNSPPPEVPATRLRPLAFLTGAAGAKFSNYPEADDQDMLVSLPLFMQVAEQASEASRVSQIRSSKFDVSSVPIRLVIVKIDEATATDAILDKISRDLGRRGAYYGCSIEDVRRSNARLAVAVEAMDFFSASTMALAMIISFFSLTSSMYANISEQTKEIGMLRALGVKKRWIQRVYTLEAFTLVTAATVMGLGMGTAVAYTVTAQRALFTQLPVPFRFPWVIFGWVAAASCLSALGASFLPATRKARQNIASLMRSVM